MSIDWLLDRMNGYSGDDAIVWQDRCFRYRDLLAEASSWDARLEQLGIPAGEVTAIVGAYSPGVVGCLLALIRRGNVIVPLTRAVDAHREEFLQTAEASTLLLFDPSDRWSLERRPVRPSNQLTLDLARKGRAGLVLFSSGSTGRSKAALHDFPILLEKFRTPRRRIRTLVFLLFDHIGGVNTLFYTLANGGTLVAAEHRDPESVCRAIERHRVELLPTSPTFLNLLLLSEAHRRHDLSSLRLITYGTEVMPETTLLRVREAFPRADLQQTYGLSELGILRSKSRDSGSLWVKIGGEGFEVKVVDGTLWIRARSAMLGYLNAPSPFDAEGWFNTQDEVEVDGEYVRILGRRSDVINVGGQKVHASEVENVLLQMSNVQDATVVREPNPLTGSAIVAQVALAEAEDAADFKRRMRTFCSGRLERFKIPVKVEIVEHGRHGARFKKIRPQGRRESGPTP